MKNVKYTILFLLLLILNSCKSDKQHIIDDTNHLIMDSIKNNKNKIISNNIKLEKYRQIIKIDDNEKPKYNGTLTYRIDSIFIIGTTSKVEAKITKKIYNGEPIEMIELYTNSTSGEIKTKEIITGEIMDINLIPLDIDAFIINKISSNNQRVDENIITEWMWGITPQKIGNFNLILKVIIKLKDGVNIDQTVFDKIINVENKPKRNFNI